MFRKPFKVKSNTNIRNSERRKLRENLAKLHPNLSQEDLVEFVPNKDEISVSRILTSSEKQVSCYFWQKNPIVLEVDGVLLPTVYTLWRCNPPILTFTMPSNVFSIIATNGADLMFPGIIFENGGVPHFEKNQPCAVVMPGNNAAVAVGITSCSSEDLLENGPHGKRVSIYHCYQDQLWLAGDKTDLPMIQSPVLVEQNDNEEEEHAEPQEISSVVETKGDQSNYVIKPPDSSIPTMTPQEQMDELLKNCFYQALLNAKKVELPMLVSSFSSQYLHPVCPEGRRIDVKKSSHKKMSKFLAEMQTDGLVEVKELSKGVDSITKISVENESIKQYKSTDFASTQRALKDLQLEEQKEKNKQEKQTLKLREMYAVSAKVVPFFALFNVRKAGVMAASDVRQLLARYIKEHELPSQRGSVTLDTMLTDTLFKKKEHKDTLTWDVLLKTMLDNMNECHEITIPGKPPIIKKGKTTPIEVSVEQRMGNKKITAVKNLETFGIDVKEFASSLQQMAASSTTVAAAPGKNTTCSHVVVQGIQTKHIKTLLETTYKVPLRFIKGLDSTGGGKKKR